jgi:hypothetical protein
MAVTITRTPWIDDDGTGTTGTVINNAVKTALYNDIDGALAKVASLAGGNAFTGTQSTTGTLLVGTTANPFAGQFAVSGSSNAGTGTVSVFTNTYTGNTGGLLWFINSAGAGIGTIAQTNATTVAYNTTSDARLKDDAGRAVDLTALRAVVVHDFAWKADGRSDRGVFAQDAHAVYPRAVTVGTDETTASGALARPWMTDYSKFVPDLIVGWQQHDAELAELRALLTTEGL